MSPTKFTRNERLLRRRREGFSTRELAREFGISQAQVRRILTENGGDPKADLQSERAKVAARIAADRRRLRELDQEIAAQATDRILGLI